MVGREVTLLKNALSFLPVFSKTSVGVAGTYAAVATNVCAEAGAGSAVSGHHECPLKPNQAARRAPPLPSAIELFESENGCILFPLKARVGSRADCPLAAKAGYSSLNAEGGRDPDLVQVNQSASGGVVKGAGDAAGYAGLNQVPGSRQAQGHRSGEAGWKDFGNQAGVAAPGEDVAPGGVAAAG